MPHLLFENNEIGKQILPKKEVVTLGRHSTCEVIVLDPSISRRHAQISLKGTQFILRDLESRNGTYLNNNPVSQPVVIQEGDVIHF